MRQAIAQARHAEMIEKARNDGWIDGRMDNNDGSWTPGRYNYWEWVAERLAAVDEDWKEIDAHTAPPIS